MFNPAGIEPFQQEIDRLGLARPLDAADQDDHGKVGAGQFFLCFQKVKSTRAGICITRRSLRIRQ
jgi:hypothetical protein